MRFYLASFPVTPKTFSVLVWTEDLNFNRKRSSVGRVLVSKTVIQSTMNLAVDRD